VLVRFEFVVVHFELAVHFVIVLVYLELEYLEFEYPGFELEYFDPEFEVELFVHYSG
jgi:hypothetical protein